MQQLKISFFRLQTLKKALLFLKNFRKGGEPPLNPPRPLQNNIFPPLAKVLVAPLGKLICHVRLKKGGRSVNSSDLILISEVSNSICFFYAVNTFFLTLCGLIHFSSRLQLLIVTISLQSINPQYFIESFNPPKLKY